jgi:hypothetical protein
MSKNNKGMICLLNAWEWEDLPTGGTPDCRNHPHLSRRRLCERVGDARFADRVLADVYDVQGQRIGFIVQVANRVIWADNLGNWKSRVKIDPASWKTINGHLNRLQAITDSGERPRCETIKLTKCRAITVRIPPRDAAINETLRSHSPCALTANESELNAEWGWIERREQRDQES